MKRENKQEDNLIRVADKPMGNYLSAIAIKLEKYDQIEMTAFGRNLDKIFNLAKEAANLFPVIIKEIKSFTQENAKGLPHKGISVTLVKKHE